MDVGIASDLGQGRVCHREARGEDNFREDLVREESQ